MTFLPNTAHLQFGSFWVGIVGWILSAISTGLIEWRIWYVSDTSIITSGVAWVGIWKACFFSDKLVSSELKVMYCQRINISDPFAPTEIYVAQGLMVVAIIAGAAAKASSVYAFRNIYFGINESRPIRIALSLGGALFIFSGVCVLIPVSWNMNSVVENRPINFPSEFHMPSSPSRQEIGAGIAVGIVSSVLSIFTGLVFLVYKFPERQNPRVQPLNPRIDDFEGSSIGTSFSSRSGSAVSRDIRKSLHGEDNLAFQSEKL
ncbi:claudin-34 [Lepisosteus oculatus]|nr:PREDICTED: claudin-34 [Lepisosteus oculatus]